MTTGTPLEQVPFELRAWTMRQLALDPGATPADVRSIFVQRLAEEDFVPPWRWQQAFSVVHRPAEAAGRVLGHGQLFADEEERLREEVSAFAGDFFTLGPEERKRRFSQLWEACEPYPALTDWLRELAPWLTLVPAVPEDPRVAELADHVRRLFVLRPGARAGRRRALLQEMQAELSLWEAAADQLCRSQLALASLEPVLIQYLRTWRKQMAERRVRALQQNQQVSGGGPVFQLDIGQGRPLAAPDNRRPASGSGWPVLVMIFAVLAFIGAVMGPPSRQRSYSPPAQPWLYTAPQIDTRWLRPDFTPTAETDYRKLYEDILRQHGITTAPTRPTTESARPPGTSPPQSERP